MTHIDKKAKLIRSALWFAEEKHKSQFRKKLNSPYIHHPIMVSYVAANYKKSKNLHKLIAAAILHDVLEDTTANAAQLTVIFGKTVSSLVFELTDDKYQIQKVGKLAYQKAKWPGLSNYGLYLKLCDRLCNLSDNPTQQYKEDTGFIISRLKKKRKLTKSQKSVVKEIEKIIDEN